MTNKSRVPPAVGSIPVVGELVKQAEEQARWLQDVVEQNARLVGQLPATMKSFNDSLERFNQTVARLDRVVSRVERAANQLIGPLDLLAQRMDRLASVLGEMPGVALVRRLTGLQSDAAHEAAGEPGAAKPKPRRKPSR
jgi:ABC-type transporter Mla subunit MlaD